MNEPAVETTLPPLTVHWTDGQGAPPAFPQTVAVVYNPTAGSGPGKKTVDIAEIRDRFVARGVRVATIGTRCAGDGTAAAQYAIAQGAQVVCAMGGDGTVNEVVQALVGGDVPLGVLPAGTINILARELNIPLEPLEAIDSIVDGHPRPIDVGRCNGRYFIAMIGLGYDAESARVMLPALKRVSGTLAYWIGAFQSFATHKAVRSIVTYDDGRRKRRIRRLVYMLIVSNAGLYAGGLMKFTPEANMRDGLLDCCLIRTARWYRGIVHVVLSFIGRLNTVRDVDFFQAKTMTVTTARPFPYQLDGDPVGFTPLTVDLVPDGLRVMAPKVEA